MVSITMYREHQIEGGEWALNNLRTQGIAYLSWRERVGKSGAAIWAAENSTAQSVLIVTKKKAIPGWKGAIDMFSDGKTTYTVTNYESAHKVKGDFQLVILDEAHHAISSVGRPSKTWKTLAPICKDLPIIYLSATPYAEHMGLIYHQLKLSSWTPFKQRNFYEWFKVFGVSKMKMTPNGLMESYTKYNDTVIFDKMKHLFSFKTREEVGIEHEPTVNLIKVNMNTFTLELVEQLKTYGLITIGEHMIMADTPAKTRSIHYQLEGATIKLAEGYIPLPTREKILYIKDNYPADVAIMAHFIAERDLLKKMLPEAHVYSADGDAEGVDMSHHDKLIIYSMSEKTSKFTQRLARQANHKRETPIIVDVLVGDKPCIGNAIYESVAIKKENFDANSYKRSL